MTNNTDVLIKQESKKETKVTLYRIRSKQIHEY